MVETIRKIEKQSHSYPVLSVRIYHPRKLSRRIIFSATVVLFGILTRQRCDFQYPGRIVDKLERDWEKRFRRRFEIPMKTVARTNIEISVGRLNCLKK